MTQPSTSERKSAWEVPLKLKSTTQPSAIQQNERTKKLPPDTTCSTTSLPVDGNVLPSNEPSILKSTLQPLAQPYRPPSQKHRTVEDNHRQRILQQARSVLSKRKCYTYSELYAARSNPKPEIEHVLPDYLCVTYKHVPESKPKQGVKSPSKDVEKVMEKAIAEDVGTHTRKPEVVSNDQCPVVTAEERMSLAVLKERLLEEEFERSAKSLQNGHSQPGVVPCSPMVLTPNVLPGAASPYAPVTSLPFPVTAPPPGHSTTNLAGMETDSSSSDLGRYKMDNVTTTSEADASYVPPPPANAFPPARRQPGPRTLRMNVLPPGLVAPSLQQRMPEPIPPSSSIDYTTVSTLLTALQAIATLSTSTPAVDARAHHLPTPTPMLRNTAAGSSATTILPSGRPMAPSTITSPMIPVPSSIGSNISTFSYQNPTCPDTSVGMNPYSAYPTNKRTPQKVYPHTTTNTNKTMMTIPPSGKRDPIGFKPLHHPKYEDGAAPHTFQECESAIDQLYNAWPYLPYYYPIPIPYATPILSIPDSTSSAISSGVGSNFVHPVSVKSSSAGAPVNITTASSANITSNNNSISNITLNTSTATTSWRDSVATAEVSKDLTTSPIATRDWNHVAGDVEIGRRLAEIERSRMSVEYKAWVCAKEHVEKGESVTCDGLIIKSGTNVKDLKRCIEQVLLPPDSRSEVDKVTKEQFGVALESWRRSLEVMKPYINKECTALGDDGISHNTNILQNKDQLREYEDHRSSSVASSSSSVVVLRRNSCVQDNDVANTVDLDDFEMCV